MGKIDAWSFLGGDVRETQLSLKKWCKTEALSFVFPNMVEHLPYSKHSIHWLRKSATYLLKLNKVTKKVT